MNSVKSCGNVYGISTYPSVPFPEGTQNGKIVPTPSGCGSKGSVSNVEESYSMSRAWSQSRLCSIEGDRKPTESQSFM